VKKDHRPYYLKKAWLKFQSFYVGHFLAPQFDSFGKGYTFFQPWHVKLFGTPIHAGNYLNVIATADKKVRISVWSVKPGEKEGIRIGNAVLICPGVRISAASRIEIGNSCMMASSAYITDCDWHGIYDRVNSSGQSAPVKLEDNVWIGDSAIVCKGVTIGKNSIIGAGSVVVCDIPANVIAAGNPARIVRELSPDHEFVTRERWFEDASTLGKAFDYFDRVSLDGNTLWGWFKSLAFPRREE
jgi:acetyltransferase-like isoleucine patch superfamily enzyme